MDPPFGHHNRHHHRRDDDDEENRERPYPPPDFQDPPFRGPPREDYQDPPFRRPGSPREDYQDPPFRGPGPPREDYQDPPFRRPGPPREDYQDPPFRGPGPPREDYQDPPFRGPPPRYNQEPQFEAPPPPPRPYQAEFEAQPPPTQVYHTSHHGPEESESHQSYKPHSSSGTGSELSNKPTVKVSCKADPDFSLAIRDDKVILARSDPNDEFQHWYRDEKLSTRVKDSEGFPCFSLVNKATGQALKHSIGASHPVQLIPYISSDKLDMSILWTQSKDMSAGYRTIRMVNNIHLNMDAFHGDKKSGGVHDGTSIVLWEWNKGDNQLWKIVPYCKFLVNQNIINLTRL